MRFLLIAILLVCVIASGCAPARIHTIQKDRVDQRTEGNRGYVMGTPPPAPVSKGAPKRTLIALDLEIGLLPSEKEKLNKAQSDEAGNTRSVETNFGPKGQDTGYVVTEEETVVEEEWVK